MQYFSIFFKRFNKPCVNSLRVWTKNTIYWKFRENFQKTFKKISNNALFLHIFEQNLTNHSLHFCAFGRKTRFIGNFEKIFESFQKFS